MKEVEQMIDEIVDQSNGQKWNFTKTKATIVDFDNKMKDLYSNDTIDRFFVKSNNVNNINKVVEWLGTRLDVERIPIYSQEEQLNSLFITQSQERPTYWIIFFRLCPKTI
ncbi:MAG TPA: hypothetical protein VMW01_07315 [Williamwhitmania sp.]|nr:hypothetical protein [Williamwhitmania sp.]